MHILISISRSHFKRAHLLSIGVALLLVPLLLSCTGHPSPELSMSASPSGESTTALEVDQTEIGPQTNPIAQHSQDPKFVRLSTEQGLSQTVVTSILQDQKGFMWFGTQDGLNRYDGYEFKVYKFDPDDPHSLGDNFIMYLLEDQDGTLWIGTNEGGLNKFDRQKGRFTRYQHDPDNPNSLGNNTVQTIYQSRNGKFWVGTDDGLDVFDPQTETFSHYKNDPDDPNSLGGNDINAIFEDQDGKFWIGSIGAGLSNFDPHTGLFTSYQNDPEDPHSLSDNTVQAIYEDRDGMLWVGTVDGGLSKFDRKKEQFTHFQHDPANPFSLSDNNVQVIYTDRSGNLWIGTGNGGLERFDRESEQFHHIQNDPSDPQSLSSNNIFAIYEDRAGVFWVGTFGSGINKFDPHKKKFELYQKNPLDPNSLGIDVIWALQEDLDGNLWIGTNGGGLDRFNRETGQFTHYRNVLTDTNSLSDDTVWALHQDQVGDLWIGTSNGVDRFDPATEQFIHYPTFLIFSFYEDQEGTLWVGAFNGGLGKFDRQSGSFSYYQNDPADPSSLSHNNVVAIAGDQQGAIWVGTFNGGLNKFDPETETFTRYQSSADDPSSLSHNTVLTIHEDQDGVLWIGTAGGGLNKFDRSTETFITYWEKDGLDNYIYGILEDGQGFLWLSTNHGLFKFDPHTEKAQNYDVSDGLQNIEFNQTAYHKSPSGEMFFGGVSGLNAFFPDDVKDNTYIPPIVITEFSLYNQPVSVGDASPLKNTIEETTEIELSYLDDFLSFTFSALHFSTPEENQYAYILEGFDKDWNYVGSRHYAGYTNVPPGNYTFRVKGSNSDGIWNEEGASLEVKITPPIWQTWWFRGLAAVLLIGGVLGGFALRVRVIENQKQQLEKQVNERTEELQITMLELKRSKEAAEAADKAKSVFLANISHELRTPLNAILGFSQLMLRSADDGAGKRFPLDQETRENLEIINRSGEHLLGLINDVLEMSKIEAGRPTLNMGCFDLHRLLGGLEGMFRIRAESKGLGLDFDIDDQVPGSIFADEGKLRQILMNLLGNAVKFTRSGGVVLRARVLETSIDRDGAEDEIEQQPILKIEVEDSGPGIAPEDLEAIFDPFVQSISGIQAQEGTGLGLTISREFTGLMEGALTVDSELGKGSIFTVEIPFAAVEPSADQRIELTRRVVALAPGQLTYRILAVDDKEVNRTLLIKLLSPLGFEVKEASNGEEALKIWEQWEPHLIWMDMRMPVMDGYEATRSIKATIKGQATVIIALTASALEEDRAIILSEGCDAYIRKPFLENELFDALSEHLGVKFIYEEIKPDLLEAAAEKEAFKRDKKHRLSQSEITESLRKIPSDQVASLHQTLILGYMDNILAQISQIHKLDPILGTELVRLANNYEHDRIITCIRNSGSDV